MLLYMEDVPNSQLSSGDFASGPYRIESGGYVVMVTLREGRVPQAAVDELGRGITRSICAALASDSLIPVSADATCKGIEQAVASHFSYQLTNVTCKSKP